MSQRSAHWYIVLELVTSARMSSYLGHVESVILTPCSTWVSTQEFALAQGAT